MRIGVFAVLPLIAIGCTGGRVLQDSDGNSYPVKVMSDGRAWTTTNLRLALPGSYCYGERRIRMSSLRPFVYVGICRAGVHPARNRLAIAYGR
jgi:hypothetical protein